MYSSIFSTMTTICSPHVRTSVVSNGSRRYMSDFLSQGFLFASINYQQIKKLPLVFVPIFHPIPTISYFLQLNPIPVHSKINGEVCCTSVNKKKFRKWFNRFKILSTCMCVVLWFSRLYFLESHRKLSLVRHPALYDIDLLLALVYWWAVRNN